MADTGLNQVLDQSQIADAINRQKIGSQRQRREMMRLGETDPNAFSLQNKSFLQQAQQPTEFLGAGRKEISNPNYDASAANLVGGIQDTSYGKFYYGDVDPSTAQWGTKGYTTKDLGGGVYDIFNSSGTSIGHGYYDPITAANQIFKQNALNQKNSLQPTKAWFGVSSLPTTQTNTEFPFRRNQSTEQAIPDGYRVNPNYNPDYALFGNRFSNNSVDYTNPYQQLLDGYSWGGKDYKTLQEAQSAIDAATGSWGGGNQAGGLADWEILGQALDGALGPAGLQEWGSLPINNKSENISGLNTLFGSTPLIVDGKLLGYKSNFGAAPGWKGSASGSGGQDQIQWNPFGYQASHSGKSHSWSTGLGRQIDPNAYQGIVQNLGNFDYFVPLSNVEKLPGWTNVENYNHKDLNYGALASMGDAGKAVTVIADLAGLFFTGVPIGSLLAAGVGYAGGEDKAATGYLKNAAIAAAGDAVVGGLTSGAEAAGSGLSATSGGTGAGMGSSLGSGISASSGISGLGMGSALGSGITAPVGSGLAGSFAGAGAGGVLGSGVSLGSATADKIAQNYLLNTAMSYAKSGNLEQALKSAAFSTASGVGGSWLADATQGQLGDIASKALGGAASGGLNSLFSKGSPIAGSLYGAMSGGLHGFLNSTDIQNKTFNQQANNRNLNLARNVTGLAKIMLRNKDGSTKTTR